MGIFLTRPSTEVVTDVGTGAGVRFAVGEMQGWRKHMEDAHIACPAVCADVKDELPISLFGVFDGHGGKEVSAFVKLKYVDVLLQLPSFQEGRYRDALRESFHKIDELLEDEQYEALLKQLRAVPNPSDLRKENNHSQGDNSLGNHSSSSRTVEVMQSAASRDGNNVGSMIQPLTAPDRSASPESDDGDDANSPLPHGKVGDVDSMTIITQLLEGAKQYSRAKSRNDSDAIAAAAASVAGNLRTLQAARVASSHAASPLSSANDDCSEGTTPSAYAEDYDDPPFKSRAAAPRVDDGDDADVENNLERDSEDFLDHDFVRHHIERGLSESPAPPSDTTTSTTTFATTGSTNLTAPLIPSAESCSPSRIKEEGTDSDVSSSSDPEDVMLAGLRTAPVTKPVVVLESTSAGAGASDSQKPSPPKSPSKANANPFKGETYQTVFSERVNEDVVQANDNTPDAPSSPIPAASQPSLQPSHMSGSDATSADGWMNEEDSSSDEDISPPKAANRPRTLDTEYGSERNNASEATEVAAPAGRPPAPVNFTTFKTTGNNHVCQLRDHKVLAGCTAIVALLVGEKYMLVANAGDSRGVLCRNGVAVALSEDHKPSQEREIRRIKNAGGFVNMVGRVNGNLNLSRSLGDLKYKQVKHLPPEEQMITAEPDIEMFEIHPDEDEFFILACDGIWDVLTNQEACDFVREKVLGEHMSLDEVVHAVMKRCLAKDPRGSQGIGGDNMTFLVVWLQQATMPPVSRVVPAPGEPASTPTPSSSTFSSSSSSSSSSSTSFSHQEESISSKSNSGSIHAGNSSGNCSSDTPSSRDDNVDNAPVRETNAPL